MREATKAGEAQIEMGACVDMTQPNSKTRRGRSMVEKSNCLVTSPQYYQYCAKLCYAVPCEWDENGYPVKAVSCSDGKTYPVYKVDNGEITIKDKQYPIKLVNDYYIIRKLTVSECMRLQTVPEWYDFSCVSNSQAYKMLGNGWTVEVIAHLIRSALDERAVEAQARQCLEEFMENIEMTTDREVKIMERAIEKYGEVPQIIVAIEECSELIKALTKWLRYMDRDSDTQNELLDNVREEMADVNIMLNQLVLIFGECYEIEIAKLERLERRLRDET